MLSHARRRSADDGLAYLEAGGRLRLPDAADRRLLEFGNDAAGDNLFVVNDLAPTQDRSAGNVDSAGLSVHTLAPADGQPLFVHLHYTRGNPVEAQQTIRTAVGAKPEIGYRGAYVPQHWSQPQFFQ